MIVSAYAIVNDIQIDLEQNTETGYWEATAVAPVKSSYNLDGHYYGVTLTAVDEAGNDRTIDVTDTEFGEALKLIVRETVAPVVTISSPTDGELTNINTPTVEFSMTDDDSGIDTDTVVFLIDGKEITDYVLTEIADGYSVSYNVTSALDDGEHTVTVRVADHDGNETESAVTFEVQTAAPSLAVTSPADGEYFNETEITVEGTTDGALVTVAINGGSPVEVEIIDGTFSQTFTLDNGENEIVITATSASGVETVITRTVTIDTTAPRFVSVSLKPNPVEAGKTYIISVEVVDDE